MNSNIRQYGKVAKKIYLICTHTREKGNVFNFFVDMCDLFDEKMYRYIVYSSESVHVCVCNNMSVCVY